MKKILFILLAGALLSSCAEKKKGISEAVIGKWRGFSQDNPELEMMIKGQEMFLDTVGNSTTPEQNREIYGTDDMAAFKADQRARLEKFKEAQYAATTNTIITLKEDGTAILDFDGSPQTAKWRLALVLDAQVAGDSIERVVMDIDYANDTAMKLRFNEQEFSGSVIFHPEKEKK